jgi:hypothetical protein
VGFAEKRGDYWRGRYKLANGKYGTVKDDNGATVRFGKRRDAEQAANDAEASVRNRTWRDPTAGRITFGEYVSRWFAAQDLAASTMQNYRHHIEGHLIPYFGDMAVADILPSDVAAWEKLQRSAEAGYAEASIRGRWKVLHVILADAVEEKLREGHPAPGPRPGRQPVPNPRTGEGHHERTRGPAHRRTGGAAVRPRR